MSLRGYLDYLAQQGPEFHRARLYVMRDQIPRLLWQAATAALRTLPDIQLLGAQKAGTTTVHAMLLQHPDVATGIAKESHFFDGRSIFGPPRRPWVARCLYRAFFPPHWRRWSHRLATGRPLRVVDATPITLMLPEAPRLLRRLTPDARLLAVLRDPVARAWSHYRMNVRWGREPLSFEAALDAEEALWSRGPCDTAAHWHRSYLHRGLYAEQLRRFRDAGFPADQLLLVSFDDLARDPQDVAERLYAFLGLRPHPVEGVAENRGDGDAAVPAHVALRLRAAFRASTEALVDELGFSPASGWL